MGSTNRTELEKNIFFGIFSAWNQFLIVLVYSCIWYERLFQALSLSFSLFILFMGLSEQEHWSGLPFQINPEYSLEGLILKLKLQYFWPSDVKSWLTGKDPDTGEDWKKKKRVTEDEMVRSHHWVNGHEFEQTLGNSKGQGGLACCHPWGCRESDTTERLNWTDDAKALNKWHEETAEVRISILFLNNQALKSYDTMETFPYPFLIMRNKKWATNGTFDNKNVRRSFLDENRKGWCPDPRRIFVYTQRNKQILIGSLLWIFREESVYITWIHAFCNVFYIKLLIYTGVPKS